MKYDINTLILDVDGVINGGLEGVNSPFPSEPVVARLQEFASKPGNQIVFCTSKGVYPIAEMVDKFGFHGVHIADAGGVVYDSLTNEYTVNGFQDNEAVDIIAKMESTNKYFEVYTDTDWYILDKFSDMDYISIHSMIMRKKPVVLRSFDDFNQLEKVSKFMLFTEDETDSKESEQIMDSLGSDFNTKWTGNPMLGNVNLIVVTKPGVSKKDSVQKLHEDGAINLEKCLGAGDYISDWKFMSICGYQGVMGNSDDELMKKASENDTAFVGGYVDDDGVLDIFDHFGV